MTVAVDHLPLKDEAAIHKFKLLAGPRWTPEPPKDAGVSRVEEWGNGYIKISMEDFPEAEKNLKWASDTLDKLVAEANVRTCYSFVLFLADLSSIRTSLRSTPRFPLTCAMLLGERKRRRKEIILAVVYSSGPRSRTSQRSGYRKDHPRLLYDRSINSIIIRLPQTAKEC